MRRVAILTQPLHLNYGGVLQAYALQHIVKMMSFYVTTDRHCSRLKKPLTPPKYLRHLRHELRSKSGHQWSRPWPTHREVLAVQGAEIERFIAERITTTELFDSHGRATKEATEYDIYIVGSDQVWRPRYSDNIKSYFLDFLDQSDARRISYAASFGGDCSDEYNSKVQIECGNLLRKFSAISVRESIGKRLCLELFGRKSQLVADPTLLLPKEHYEQLCATIEPTSGRLTSYILDRSDKLTALVESVAKEMELTLTSPQAKGLYPQVTLAEAIAPSVEEWLASFRDSELVITDSFHGTIFAIIFERPFITIFNNERGNSRILSLLKAAGLQERVIPAERMGDRGYIQHIIDQPIDYIKVKSTLESLITSSERFLSKALE